MLGADSATKLQNSDVVTYGYANHEEFFLSGNAYPFGFPTGGPPEACTVKDSKQLDAGTVGYTDDGCAFEIFSAIFETDAPEGSSTNPYLEHTTAHEMGHQLDYQYRSLGDSPTSYISLSSQFETALQMDLQNHG